MFILGAHVQFPSNQWFRMFFILLVTCGFVPHSLVPSPTVSGSHRHSPCSLAQCFGSVRQVFGNQKNMEKCFHGNSFLHGNQQQFHFAWKIMETCQIILESKSLKSDGLSFSQTGGLFLKQLDIVERRRGNLFVWRYLLGFTSSRSCTETVQKPTERWISWHGPWSKRVVKPMA